MSGFDTSGVVYKVSWREGTTVHCAHVSWDGTAPGTTVACSPFVQGCASALLEEVHSDPQKWCSDDGMTCRLAGFSDLAPETLARIMKDCAAHERAYPLMAHDPRRHNRGLNFWRNRQAGMWASSGWPPLTLYLCDDGKVRFQ